MHGVHIKFNIKPKKSRPTSSTCLGYVNGLDNFTQRWFDSSSGHVSDRTSLPIMVPSLIKTEYKTVPSTLQYGVLKPACLTAFIIVLAHSHLCFDRIFGNYFILFNFCLYHAHLQFTNERRNQKHQNNCNKISWHRNHWNCCKKIV